VLQKTGDVKQNHIVAPQEQLRLNISQQFDISNNVNSINKILLNNSNNTLFTEQTNNIFINKNNFYLFNENLLDFNNKLKLKKTN
jgi:hypothetical protein